jgi:hypothetical protein
MLPLPCFRLDLRSNGVGLLGCKALSNLLKDRNASITKLNMAGNAADNMILEVRTTRMQQALVSCSACQPAAAADAAMKGRIIAVSVHTLLHMPHVTCHLTALYSQP